MPSNIDVKRYTGYRIQFENIPREAKQMRWSALRGKLQPLLELVPLLQQEEFLIDDVSKGLDGMTMLMKGLDNGELFVPHIAHGADTLIGIVKITDIVPGRYGTVEAWSHPLFRNPINAHYVHDSWEEIKDYCFAPFPEGLGLQKLKASVCAANRLGLEACGRRGFVQIGVSPLDAFHNEIAHDSVLLELHNPVYFGTVVDSLKNGKQPINPEGTELHSAGDLHSTSELRSERIHTDSSLRESGGLPSDAGSELDDPASEYAEPDSERSAAGGSEPPKLAKVGQRKPAKPRRLGPIPK